MLRRGSILLLGVGVLVAAVFLVTRVRRSDFPLPPNVNATALIPPDQIVEGGPGKDGIPSIDHPSFTTVANAEAAETFDGSGLGIALAIGSTSRFYPFQILVWHEIVNDVVADLPVAVTFCPLCGTGIVYDRRLDGSAVEFGVSGKLYNSDLLMYDRRTDTLWSQLDGRAVVGPLVGKHLTPVDAQNLTWDEYRAQFPNGQVLSTDTGFTRDYQRNPYGSYDSSEALYFPVAGGTDTRIHPKTRVVGVEVNGAFKAYPVDALRQAGTVEDTVGGTALRLTAMSGTVTVRTAAGETMVPVHAFWFAWAAFHPGTELFQP